MYVCVCVCVVSLQFSKSLACLLFFETSVLPRWAARNSTYRLVGGWWFRVVYDGGAVRPLETVRYFMSFFCCCDRRLSPVRRIVHRTLPLVVSYSGCV